MVLQLVTPQGNLAYAAKQSSKSKSKGCEDFALKRVTIFSRVCWESGNKLSK